MKKIKQFSVLLLIILLICGCGDKEMGNNKVLVVDEVKNNMKLYLLDKYGKEYEIDCLVQEEDGAEQFFVAEASDGYETFYVRTDLYSEVFGDSKCMGHFTDLLEMEIEEQIKEIWGNGTYEVYMSFYDYVAANEWSDSSELGEFMKAEDVLVRIKIELLNPKLKKEIENEKIQLLIQENVDKNIFAQYTITYVDGENIPVGKYVIGVFEDEGVPSLEEIGENCNE